MDFDHFLSFFIYIYTYIYISLFSECNTACPRDPDLMCGAMWRMNVYDTGRKIMGLGLYLKLGFQTQVSKEVLSTQIKTNVSFQIYSQAGQWKSRSHLLKVPSVCSWTQLYLGLDHVIQLVKTLLLSLFRFSMWKKFL